MKKLILSFAILVLTACSSSNKLGNTPTPPSNKPDQIGKIIGKLPATNASNQINTEPKVAIMHYSSGVITIWATAPNNWLWGYSPFDSNNLGNLRHWYILKNRNGSVSFRNAQIGTCIAAHGNGIVHIGCDPNSLEQQFDFLLLTNGAVAIRNAANQQCLMTPLFRKTIYMPLVFANCIRTGEQTQDQQWFIIPPIEDSYPIPTKG